MSYYPNENAIIWFLEHCFSKIKQELPTVKLKIAGANPSKKLFAYAQKDDSIIITGFVENLAFELQNAQVAIAPMQIGSGMQSKVLQALACGLPVVTTSLGKGSIHEEGYEIFKIANLPDEFAQSCIELLIDYNKCQQMGSEAVNFIEKYYGWDINCQRIEELYNSMIKPVVLVKG